jgi:DNA polymerase-1
MEPKVPFANCAACPLKSARLVPSDPIQPNAEYWIVGESPGQNEVRNAENGEEKPGFTGYSGKMLWSTLAQLGVTRDQCNVTNTVLCSPPTEREEKEEVLAAAAMCCSGRLRNEISQTQTSKILALGKTAREAFFGLSEGESLTTLHGRWSQNPVFKDRHVLSTYHPAFILRSPDDARTMIDDLKKFVHSTPPKELPAEPIYNVIATEADLRDVLQRLSANANSVVAFDIETTQVNWLYDDILLLVLYTKVNGIEETYIIPGRHPEAPIDLLYGTRETMKQEWKDFWECAAIEFVGHNGKFDVRFLRALLLHPAHVDFDTMLAHYVLDERKGTHDLKGLAARYLNIADYEVSLKKYLRSKNDYYNKIPWRVICQYAAWDGYCTYHLKFVLEELLKKSGQYHMPFKQMMMPFDEMLVRMELRGFQVDAPYLSSQQGVFEKELDRITKEFVSMSKGEVQNLNSPKQLSGYIYDTLKMPRPKSRKVKSNSTNHEVLIGLRGKHPAIDLLLAHRKLAKLKSSYIDVVLSSLDEEGNTHCDVKQHGTEHGRISVADPALQTLPRPYESPWSKVIRDSFVAHEGYTLLVCDFSQAELRIAAALSGEPFLLKVYADGRDLHTEVAKAMFGLNFTKEDRVHCKMFNFSYLYGGSEYSFAMDAGLPVSVASEFVKEYNKLMPRLTTWKGESFVEMQRKGYIKYRTGFRRRIPYISHANNDEARKASFNAPIAGSASHMTTLSALAVEKSIRSHEWDAFILMLVHDSIVLECRPEDVKDVAFQTTWYMRDTATKWFPEVVWKAEAEAGERWGSLHPIDSSGGWTDD